VVPLHLLRRDSTRLEAVNAASKSKARRKDSHSRRVPKAKAKRAKANPRHRLLRSRRRYKIENGFLSNNLEPFHD
jgi:hypothetical protein